MENTTTNPTQITIADLSAIRSIIDVAATRGAFRANELTQVGVVYDKLSAFLTAVTAQLEAQNQTDSSDEVSNAEDQSQGE